MKLSRGQTDVQGGFLLAVMDDETKKQNKQKGTKFWLWRHNHGRVCLRSAGAVAAVLKDALLEEGTELADVVFGEVGVAVSSKRRAGGGEHHPEQVPQVVLHQNHRRTDQSQKTNRQIWLLSGSATAALPPGDCGAQPPCAHRDFQKVSLEGTQELQAAEEKKI